MKRYLYLFLVLLLVACGEKQEALSPIDENNPEDMQNLKAYLQREQWRDTASADMIMTNDMEKLENFVHRDDTFDVVRVGTCKGCREVRSTMVCRQVVKLKKSKLHYVQVRSSAETFAQGKTYNVITKIPDDRCIKTAGLVKNVGGIAYLVSVRDSLGNEYTGYISASCVE